MTSNRYKGVSIYLLENEQENLKFLGYTKNINKLEYGLSKNPYNDKKVFYYSKLYKAIRDFGLENFKIKILKENLNYNKQNELENELIPLYELYKPNLNKRKPRRSLDYNKKIEFKKGEYTISFD